MLDVTSDILISILDFEVVLNVIDICKSTATHNLFLHMKNLTKHKTIPLSVQ